MTRLCGRVEDLTVCNMGPLAFQPRRDVYTYLLMLVKMYDVMIVEGEE